MRYFKSLLILIMLGLFCFVLMTEPALAGPGGIIKEAGKTFWGKVFLFGLVIFFAPLIIWYSVKRMILIRRTRKLLDQIAQSDPRFDWMNVKTRCSQVFYWVHSAWDQQKIDLAQGYVTDWYIKNQQLLLDKWKREGLENVVSNVQIKKITPLYVAQDLKNPEKSRITVGIDAEMRDYLIDKQTGKVVEGDKTLGEVSTVWSFVWQNDQWMLNLIESDAMEMDYLSEKSVIFAKDEGMTA